MNIPTTSIIPIKDLKIDEKNPNKMSEKNYNALKEAIKKYGFIVPIITNNELLIADGEHRVKAAEELGMTNIPVIKLPISEVDRRILRQVMNKLKGSHDDLLDTEEYKFLKEEESLNQLFKFLPEQEKEISRILKRLENSHEEKEEYVTVGAYERAKNKTKIKTGEIYKLGQHRLMCGDSLKTEDVGLLMSDQKADVIFTDPPYGINLEVNYVDRTRGKSIIAKNMKERGVYENYKKSQKNKYQPVIGDDKPYDPTHLFQMFPEVPEMFIWGADYFADQIKDRLKGSLFIWDKKVGLEDVEFTLSEFEICWSKKKHPRKFARFQWFGMMGLGQEDTKKRVYPTQKPVNLCAWFLKQYSKEQQIIVDLFGGSGSTLIACEQLNRKCFIMEIDPVYCQVMIDRWEKYTGEEAEKII